MDFIPGAPKSWRLMVSQPTLALIFGCFQALCHVCGSSILICLSCVNPYALSGPFPLLPPNNPYLAIVPSRLLLTIYRYWLGDSST